MVFYLLTACWTTDAELDKWEQGCETNIASDVPDFYQKYFLCVDIEMNGDAVVISSDGLPPHSSYYYGSSHPNYAEFDESRGSDYTPNPNEIL